MRTHPDSDGPVVEPQNPPRWSFEDHDPLEPKPDFFEGVDETNSYELQPYVIHARDPRVVDAAITHLGLRRAADGMRNDDTLGESIELIHARVRAVLAEDEFD